MHHPPRSALLLLFEPGVAARRDAAVEPSHRLAHIMLAECDPSGVETRKLGHITGTSRGNKTTWIRTLRVERRSVMLPNLA